MTKLMRAQIGRGVGIDTTVKSAQGIWRAFAPQYAMVMGHKAGTVSDAQYMAHYAPILDRVPAVVWNTLAERETQCLLCYCRDGRFCHSHLIIEYAVQRWPDRFQDGRAPEMRVTFIRPGDRTHGHTDRPHIPAPSTSRPDRL